MASLLRNLQPPIRFHQFDRIADFHAFL
jgi:hypothetical protein